MMADRTFAIGHLHRLSTIRLARAERMPHEANGRVPFCSVLLHSPVAAVASQLPFPAIAKDRRNLPIASGGSLHAGGNSPFPSRFPGQCPATPFRCLSRTGHPSNATCEKICCDVGPARCHGPHPRHAAGGHRAARPVAWTGRRRWHGRWWRTQSIDSRTDWICRYARRTGPRQLDAGTRPAEGVGGQLPAGAEQLCRSARRAAGSCHRHRRPRPGRLGGFPPTSWPIGVADSASPPGGPLDLRFDPSQGQPAGELLQSAGADRLEQIFRDYGEDPNAAGSPGQLSSSVDASRSVRPKHSLTSSLRLSGVAGARARIRRPACFRRCGSR